MSKEFLIWINVECVDCNREMQWVSGGGADEPEPVCPDCGTRVQLPLCSHFENFPPLSADQAAVIIQAVSQMCSSK